MKRIAVLACVVLAGCLSPQEAKKRTDALVATPYAPVSFSAVEPQVRSRFTGILKDPESLQLHNVRAKRAVLKNGAESIVVCGYYNARNGFGGYTGFEGFAVEIVNRRAGNIILDVPSLRNICYSAGTIPDAL